MLLGIIILSAFGHSVTSFTENIYYVFAPRERIQTRETHVRTCIRNEFYHQAFYITAEFSIKNLMKIETKVST
jgi:hypothetical protein